MTALVSDRSRVFASSALSSGNSVVAKYVSGRAATVCRRLKETYSIGLLREDSYPSVYDELDNIAAECSELGWDGGDAWAITKEAIRNGQLFLNSLPFGIEAPSASAEPDGELVFEWYISRRQLLSVSIGSGNLIHYACILGSKRSYGSEPFFGDVPMILVDLIRQVGRG